MILIPFSAGLESTSLVYQALKKKEDFKVIYLTIENNTNKTLVEKQQREKILELFRAKYNKYIYADEGSKVYASGNGMIELPQMPVWIFGLLYAIDRDIKEIRIGYCMNDDAISYINDFKKIWYSYQPICGRKLPKLSFPLIKQPKIRSAELLPEEIFQETFFCENPRIIEKGTEEEPKEVKWEDCGNCASCRRSEYDGTFHRYKRNAKKLEDSLKLEKANFEEPGYLAKSFDPSVEMEEIEPEMLDEAMEASVEE